MQSFYYYLCLGLLLLGLAIGFFGAKTIEISTTIFGISVLCLGVLGVLLERWIERISAEKDLRKKFKKCFGIPIDWKWFSKDTSYKPWRDKNSKQQIIIQHRIDTVLFPLAKAFLGLCEKRDKLMEPYYSAQSGGKLGNLNNGKDLKMLEKLENTIAVAESKFQEACKVAREGGFKVKESAREYIEEKTKQVAKKEKEEES